MRDTREKIFCLSLLHNIQITGSSLFILTTLTVFMESTFKFNFGGVEEEGSSQPNLEIDGDCQNLRQAEEFRMEQLLRRDLLSLGRSDRLEKEDRSEREDAAAAYGIVGDVLCLPSGKTLWRASVRDIRHFFLDDSGNGPAEEGFVVEESFLNALQDSDIVSGLYEGGMKVWEGSLDLLRFFDSTCTVDVTVNVVLLTFENKQRTTCSGRNGYTGGVSWRLAAAMRFLRYI